MDRGAPARGSSALGLAVAAVGAVAVASVRDLTLLDGAGPGPAFAPAIVGVALIACGGLLALQRSGQPAEIGALRRVAAAVAGLVGAAVLVDLLGLALVTGLLTGWSAVAVAAAPLSRALPLAVVAGLATQLLVGVLAR